MKELRYSTKAKKDLKKYRNNPHKMRKLYEVLNFLVNDIEIPDIPATQAGWTIQRLYGMSHRGRFPFNMD